MQTFDGMGQWAATFACDSTVKEGQMVKLSGNGTVAACGAGEGFCGQASVVGRDQAACSVVLGGMVSVSYTGAAPALGWAGLSGDGAGGVKADEAGHTYRVVDVDEAHTCVTFVM